MDYDVTQMAPACVICNQFAQVFSPYICFKPSCSILTITMAQNVLGNTFHILQFLPFGHESPSSSGCSSRAMERRVLAYCRAVIYSCYID